MRKIYYFSSLVDESLKNKLLLSLNLYFTWQTISSLVLFAPSSQKLVAQSMHRAVYCIMYTQCKHSNFSKKFEEIIQFFFVYQININELTRRL